MGEELTHCFSNKERWKTRSAMATPWFREAKQVYRQLYKEHDESTGEGNSSIHPAQQTRQSHRQPYEGSEEYTSTIHLRNGWKSSSSSSQWQQNNERKSNQSWDYWRFSTWTEQKMFVEKSFKAQENLVQKWFRQVFLIVQVVCFSLAGNFQFTTPSHMYKKHIVPAHHIALIPCATSVAQGNLDCVPKIVFVHVISLARCLLALPRLHLPLSLVSKG